MIEEIGDVAVELDGDLSAAEILTSVVLFDLALHQMIVFEVRAKLENRDGVRPHLAPDADS